MRHLAWFLNLAVHMLEPNKRVASGEPGRPEPVRGASQATLLQKPITPYRSPRLVRFRPCLFPRPGDALVGDARHGEASQKSLSAFHRPQYKFRVLLPLRLTEARKTPGVWRDFFVGSLLSVENPIISGPKQTGLVGWALVRPKSERAGRVERDTGRMCWPLALNSPHHKC